MDQTIHEIVAELKVINATLARAPTPKPGPDWDLCPIVTLRQVQADLLAELQRHEEAMVPTYLS